MRQLICAIAGATMLAAVPGVAQKAAPPAPATAAYPGYVPMTIYVTARPVNTDTFDRQPVVNLNGEEIGRIDSFARSEETGHYYALIRIRDRVADPTPTRYRGGLVGIALHDILLREEGRSLMLSHRGEAYLRDLDNHVDIDTLTPVDTIHIT